MFICNVLVPEPEDHSSQIILSVSSNPEIAVGTGAKMSTCAALRHVIVGELAL
jgi:hypothetical protein